MRLRFLLVMLWLCQHLTTTLIGWQNNTTQFNTNPIQLSLYGSPTSYDTSSVSNNMSHYSHPGKEVYYNGSFYMALGEAKNSHNYAQAQQYHHAPQRIVENKKLIKKYGHWTRENFKNLAANYASIDQSPDAVHPIFGAYYLYQFKAFRDFMQTLPNYENAITVLHKNFQYNTPNIATIIAQLPDGCDKTLKNIVANLAQEIETKKRVQEQNARNIERKLAQQAYQEKCTAIKSYLSATAPTIKESIADSQSTMERVMLPEQIRSSYTDRFNARTDALKDSEQNNFALVNKSYALSHNTQQFLRELAIDHQIAMHCLGSAIQQQIHQEMVDLFDKTATFYYHHNNNNTLQLMTKNIGHLAEAATAYNMAGLVDESITFADCGWMLFDIVAGGVQGLGDAAHKIFLETPPYVLDKVYHYDETFFEICDGVCDALSIASYCLGNALHKAAIITEDYYAHPEHLMADFESLPNQEELCRHLLSKINWVADGLKKKIKERSFQETSRFVTRNVLEAIAINKGLKSLGFIYKELQLTSADMIGLIKEGIQGPPALALAGAEFQQTVLLAKGVDCAAYLAKNANDLDSKKNIFAAIAHGMRQVLPQTSPLQTSSSQTSSIQSPIQSPSIEPVPSQSPTQTPAHIAQPKYVSFKDEIKVLKNKYDHICKLDGKKLYFNFEHIFEGETYKNGALGGFHHDYLGHAKKNGIKKIKNIQKFKKGFYEARVLDNKGEWVRKSFFPDSWSRDKVMKTLINILNSTDSIIKQGSRATIEKKIFDGVTIRLVIDLNTAKIISTYPLL